MPPSWRLPQRFSPLRCGGVRDLQYFPGWLLFFVMMILTAIFDNAIIGFGLVDYNDALISGIRLGFAPLEDFAYTLAALLMIPTLWHLLASKK